MADATPTRPPGDAHPASERELREMNRALLASSVRLHELAADAERSQAALRRSEAKYRSLFTSMDEGFCIIERIGGSGIEPLDFRYVEVNPAFESQSGVGGVTGKTIREVVPGVSEDWLLTYDRVVRTGEPVRFERTLVPTGRDLALYAFPVEDADRDLVAVIFDDVTARNLVERALRESEERFRTLFESIDEGFCVIEMIFDGAGAPVDYRFLQVNPAFEKQCGLRDAVGKTVRELEPTHEEIWFETYGRVVRTGEPIRFSGEGAALGRWFDLYAVRIGGADSRKVAVLFTDVTGRRRMEAALQASETRYRRLFQSSKDGILILDAQTGKIIDANAFMSGLLGREWPELVGKELWEIGLFDDIGANKEAFARLQRDGYLRYEHLPLRGRNGQATQVEFVSNIYREGERLVAQCSVRDITLRVAMEQKIKLQTQALADQARSKDEFLAMLSHELRNPLAPIRSATHLLKLQERGTENPIQRQAREVIERQVATLTRLVSDLMEVSRALTGRIRLDLRTVDVHQILRHSIQTAMPLMEQRGHALVADLEGDPIWTVADATRVEEVIVNLLTNAAKYTSPGGRIEVACERRADYVLVFVRDDGAGIERSLLPRIFDLFSQGHRTLDRSQGGLGIGLSLAHRIVALHGGTLEAHSEGPGLGSEFVVRLQLTTSVGTVPTPPPTQEPAAAAAGPAGETGLRVLVVDDNLDACLMLANLLRLRGHGVQTAHTGPAALAAALAWRPEVALLDIGLPQLDGYEVARRLRAAPETRDMGLFAVTGYGTDKDVALGREAGFNAHLVKPVDLAEIDRLLAGWTAERKPGAAE